MSQQGCILKNFHDFNFMLIIISFTVKSQVEAHVTIQEVKSEGATTRDMSLNETCFYSKIQKIWILKVFAWISKSFFAWILASFFGFQNYSCY